MRGSSMPERKRKESGPSRGAQEVEVEHEEDDNGNEEEIGMESPEELTQRYRNAVANRKPPGELDDQEVLSKLVGEVMRYVLFKNHQHPNVPIRREDLVHVVSQHYSRGRTSLPGYVIQMAQAKFPEIFGFELKELKRGNGEVKVYVLRSILPSLKLEKFVNTPETSAPSSLALLVLCLIDLQGEKIEEELLLAYLKRLGITREDPHPVFGDIMMALETLVRQRILQKDKVTVPGSEGYVYTCAEVGRDMCEGGRVKNFYKQFIEGQLSA